MTWRGRVQGGVIIPEQNAKLEEGSEVIIESLTPKPATLPEEEPALAHLLRFAGAIDGLPADFAENHDHYIHGTPKK